MADLTIANLTAASALTATDPVPVEQAGAAKRTTVKGIQEAAVGATLSIAGIVTASGGLNIVPATKIVTLGDGAATSASLLYINGGGDAGKGSYLGLQIGSVGFGAIANEAAILGSGISKEVCFFSETGLGQKWLVNGSISAAMALSSGGNLGIGMTPTVQFELSGSVGQKATGTTWSNPSDERLKTIIGPADLQRCYDDVKALPLLRYKLKDDCFEGKQAADRTLTGFTANDVQKVIPKAVNVVPFAKVAIPDGEEEYQEQEFVMEQVEVKGIELIAGKPTLVIKLKEQKRLLVDEIQVEDELGNKVVYKDKDGETTPLMHSIPRMVTKTRPKERKEVIENCLNLDMSQVYMQMFGAVQLLIQKVEALEAKLK